MIESLLAAFDDFLQRGLDAAFARAFPIVATTDDGITLLQYEQIALDRPRYDAAEAKRRGITVAAPLRVTVRLVHATRPALTDDTEGSLARAILDAPTDLATRTVYGDWLEQQGRLDDASRVRRRGPLVPVECMRDIKEQEVYLGELPLMQPDGTFLVDGERRRLAVTPDAMIDDALGRMRTALEPMLQRNAGDETIMPHDFLMSDRVLRGVYNAIRGALGKRVPERSIAAIEALLERSIVEQLAPFPDGAKPAALRKAVPVVTPTAPRIATGAEQLAGAISDAIRAPFDATVQRLAEHPYVALLWPTTGEARPEQMLVRIFPPTRFVVPDGATVQRGDWLTAAPGFLDGALALGRDAHVFIDPAATGITVSESFAAAMTTRECVEHELLLRDTAQGPQELLELAAVGDTFTDGEAIARTSADEVRVEGDGTWTVVAVDLMSRRGAPPLDREVALRAERRAAFEALKGIAEARGHEALAFHAEDRAFDVDRGIDLPPGVIRLVRVTVERDRPLAIGATLLDRHGFVGKVTAIVSDAELPADAVLLGKKLPDGTRREAADEGRLYLLRAGR